MKKKLVLFLTLLFLLGGIPSVYADETEDAVWLSDESGGLYCMADSRLQWFSQDKQTTIPSGGSQYDHAFYSNGTLYLSEHRDRMLYIMAISSHGRQPELAEVRLDREYCMAATDTAWYLADGDSLFRYDCQSGLAEEMAFPAPIRVLFTDVPSQQVFAVTDTAVIQVQSLQILPCQVPSLPIRSNGSAYTDSDGNAYTFDSRSGFVKVLDTDYTGLCVSGDVFYAREGNTVLRLNKNGEVTAEYHADFPVADILASGSILYAVTGQQAVHLPKEWFTEKDVSEKSSVPPESSLPSQVSQVSQQSRIPQTSQSTQASRIPQMSQSTQESRIPQVSQGSQALPVYEVTGDMVFVPQGTTIAKLKKGLADGDRILSVTNHEGKPKQSGAVGTGWKIQWPDTCCFTVVAGDVTGEGNCNTRDQEFLRDYLFSKKEFSQYQWTAADLDSNDTVDAIDLYIMMMH